MTRKNKAVALVLFLIAVLAAVYVAVFNLDSVLKFLGRDRDPVLPHQESAPDPEPAPDTQTPVSGDDRPPVRRVTADLEGGGDEEELVPIPTRSPQAEYALLAETFAERFGSFSSHGNFSNLIELKIFMSMPMKSWIDRYVAERRGLASADVYYGITTRAYGHEILEWDESLGKGTILVQTRRQETNSDAESPTETYSQDILINFTKEVGAWKVDAAYWQ